MDHKEVKQRPSLTAERARELLDYDPLTGVLRWKVNRRGTAKAGDVAGTDLIARRSTGLTYRYVAVDGVNYQVHRLVWLMCHGTWPVAGLDHINGTGKDNRLENLREVTQEINMRNLSRCRKNTSGITGVSWSREAAKWRGQIVVDGATKHLGYFTNLADAAAARKAADRLYGFSPTHGRDPRPMAAGSSLT